MQKKKLEMIRNRCGSTDDLCIDSNGHSGGIGLWWKDMAVSLVSFSNHHILVEIKEESLRGGSWFRCGIYGWPERANKHHTWALIREVRRTINRPLVMFGDFNEILCSIEKEGGAIRGDTEMEAFRKCLDDCGMIDLGYRGITFTRSRGNNPTTMIRERLDRFVACHNWLNLFNSYDVRHFPIYKSDDAPICLCTEKHRMEEYGKKLFHFESLWLSKEECKNVVQEA